MAPWTGKGTWKGTKRLYEVESRYSISSYIETNFATLLVFRVLSSQFLIHKSYRTDPRMIHRVRTLTSAKIYHHLFNLNKSDIIQLPKFSWLVSLASLSADSLEFLCDVHFLLFFLCWLWMNTFSVLSSFLIKCMHHASVIIEVIVTHRHHNQNRQS